MSIPPPTSNVPQKSQQTQGIEYLNSFNAFSSKQKLQQALVKLQHGFVWERAKVHVATLTNPCTDFEKSMYQF